MAEADLTLGGGTPMPPMPPPAPGPPVEADRMLALDALRGLVILMLVPNVVDGFGFRAMAHRAPEGGGWTLLSHYFSHVPWRGASLWDMIMPVFVFAVGMSLALSLDRRRAGSSSVRIVGEALLRSVTLVVLGLVLQVPPRTLFEEAVPYLVLAAGLPWSRWAARGLVADSHLRRASLETPLAVMALVVASTSLLRVGRLGDYDLVQILTQLGLAYFPAVLLAGQGLRAPARRAVLILVGWGLAFMLYSPPAGLVPLGEVFDGFRGHWNNGTNLAAAFDRWFLNLLPRAEPYLGNVHGYHTLQFVPLVAQMLAGVAVARALAAQPRDHRVHVRLAAIGVAGLVLSGVLDATLLPLVKSLWTPSWALFSTSLCLLALVGLRSGFELPGRIWLLRPLAVLGGNAILLYVLSYRDRWRVVALWERWLGPTLADSPWRPVLESALVLLSLWLLAYTLDRFKIRLRV